MVWQLVEVATVAPGDYFLYPQVVLPNKSLFVKLGDGQIEPNFATVYADILVFGVVDPIGGVGGRIRSAVITRAMGAYLRENVAPLGFVGWFLGLYVVNQRNLPTLDVEIYREQ